MTRRKYGIVLDYVCLALILLPIIMILIGQFRTPVFTNAEINDVFVSYADRFCIHLTPRQWFMDAFNSMGFEVQSQIGYLMCSMLGNAVIIYSARIFIETILFIPKLFLKWMEDRSR